MEGIPARREWAKKESNEQYPSTYAGFSCVLAIEDTKIKKKCYFLNDLQAKVRKDKQDRAAIQCYNTVLFGTLSDEIFLLQMGEQELGCGTAWGQWLVLGVTEGCKKEVTKDTLNNCPAAWTPF